MKFEIKNTYSTTTGRWDGERWNINYSTELSKLIKEAGTYCRYYASDLFISWSIICEELRNDEYEGGVYVFGFRDMGVDHKEFVEIRARQKALEIYKSLWVLEISVVDDQIKMILGEGSVEE